MKILKEASNFNKLDKHFNQINDYISKLKSSDDVEESLIYCAKWLVSMVDKSNTDLLDDKTLNYVTKTIKSLIHDI